MCNINNCFNGLSHINLELSSLCNKECWFCGRREREKIYGNQNYGFIDFNLLQKISTEVPSGVTIAFHNNGEGLLYPNFGEAIKLFKHCITYIVTNGKLLIEKANEIIDNLDIISISIIENDNDNEKNLQIKNIDTFLKIREDKKPNIILRFVGNVDKEPYKKFNLIHVNRILH